MARRTQKGTTDTDPGELTARQIAYLHEQARHRNVSRVTVSDPTPITLEAVDRILAAVASKGARHAPKEIDRTSLATELSHARVRYWSNFIDDRELPQKRKRKHLAKLMSAAERLRKALREFEDLGRPGWLLLSRGAEFHEEETKQRLDELKLKQRSLEEQKSNPLGGQARRQSSATALRAVNEELNWHEQALVAYQKFGAPGILFNAELAAEAIIQWHDLSHQKMTQREIDRLLASSS